MPRDTRPTSDASFTSKRILVTGASGYLGYAIARRLIGAGASVVGLTRRSRPVDAAGLEWRIGDVTDADFLERAFAECRPQIVFHLAGVTNAARRLDRVEPSFTANALGTMLALEASARHSIERFVYCASMEEPRIESCSVPTSPYGASKFVGTLYTKMFCQVFSLPTTVVRPFFVYGPGRQPHDKLVPYVVRAYLRGETPKLGSPNRGMDWVFIDDVVDAFLRAACLPAAIGRDIDVGNGTLTTVADFVAMVRSQLGGRPAEFDSDQSRQREASPIADVEATSALLEWSPTVSLADGIRRTLAWYRQQPD